MKTQYKHNVVVEILTPNLRYDQYFDKRAVSEHNKFLVEMLPDSYKADEEFTNQTIPYGKPETRISSL